MHIDQDMLTDRTVTILHRVDAKASGAKQDAYHAITLAPAMWAETHEKSTDADGTVHLTRVVKIQIPVTTADYLTPSEWLAKLNEGASDGTFTVDTQDLAVLGGEGLTGPYTRPEVLDAIRDLPHCTVRIVRDCRNNGAVPVSSAGVLKYMSMTYVEGD